MISVIITTYGDALYLSRAIDSVLCQTIEDFEIIVVDDNNPYTEWRSSTEKIMEGYAQNDRIVYIKHTRNMNGAAARNTGLSIARGEYICFLDNDDFYLPTRLKKSLEAIKNDSTISVVFTDVAIIKDKVVKKIVKVGSCQAIDLLLDTNLFGTGSNIFIKKDLCDILGGFDVNFLRHQDIEFMLRALKIAKAIAVSEALVVKVHTGNNSQNYERFYKTKLQFNKKFETYINSLQKETQEQYYSGIYKDLLYVAIASGNRKDIIQARRDLIKYRRLTTKETIYFVFPILFQLYHKISSKYRKSNVVLSDELSKSIEDYFD